MDEQNTCTINVVNSLLTTDMIGKRINKDFPLVNMKVFIIAWIS